MKSQPLLTIDRCVCRRMNFRELLPLARAGRWSLDELIAQTGCGGECEMCLPYLRQMLRDGTVVFHQLLTSDEEPV